MNAVTLTKAPLPAQVSTATVFTVSSIASVPIVSPLITKSRGGRAQ